MLEYGVSSLNRFDVTMKAAEQTMEKAIGELHREHEDAMCTNAYYQFAGRRKIVFSIALNIALLIPLLFWNTLLARWGNAWEAVGGGTGAAGAAWQERWPLVTMVVFALLLVLFLYSLYRTAVDVYCRRLRNGGTRVEHLDKEITRRFSELNNGEMEKAIAEHVLKSEEYTVEDRNDLGQEIVSIRAWFAKENKRADQLKKISNLILAGMSLLAIILFLFIRVRGKAVMGNDLGIALLLLYVAAGATVHLMIFHAGNYLGKWAKPAGLGIAAVYGIVLMSVLKGTIKAPMLQNLEFSAFSGVNEIYLFLPVLQVLGIVLTVLPSHYGLEKEYWRYGFHVEMSYGEKPRGTKRILLFRGTLSVMPAFAFCCLFMLTGLMGAACIGLGGLLWYLANCLLKPRGSYLYAFWGRWRSMANEIFLLCMAFTAYVGKEGTIRSDVLLCFAFAIAVSFLCALAAKIANDRIY